VLRYLLPLQNPIGFSAIDFLEFAVAVSLVFCVFLRGPVERGARRLASNTALSMTLLMLLPIVLRLGLLRNHPLPEPAVSDDFSYLLLADTFRHGRLANPTHPLHQFFETYFVLQQPTYSSIFPAGQGIVLALGWLIFGHPWAGVALSTGLFCALCYWMLRGWTTAGWALLGGVLAVVQFGPLNQWMNSYWGGAVSACAGCLAIGVLPRRNGLLLGLGLGLQVLTRPYEAVLLGLSVFVFAVPWITRRNLGFALLGITPAILFTLLQNRAVTQSWTTLPYVVSRYQYGVPPTFTWQPNTVPHSVLTPEQQLAYEAGVAVHGTSPDTFFKYWERWAERIRFYRFFFLPPLYLAAPFFLLGLRQWRYIWVILCLAIFSLGTNFYPYFYSHYIAAIACLFVLIAVKGLEQLERLAGPVPVKVIIFLCLTHFMFWFSVHAFGSAPLLAAITPYETWDAINYGDPEGRIAIRRQLDGAAGKQLVFVHYSAGHQFQEWVHNGAVIDGQQIVWARDLGEENAKLLAYYPDRTPWVLEPDAKPPRLSRYQTGQLPGH
jgi:hypothetical protein